MGSHTVCRVFQNVALFKERGSQGGVVRDNIGKGGGDSKMVVVVVVVGGALKAPLKCLDFIL